MIDADALLKQFPLPEDMRDPKQALKHITGIRAEIECAPTIEPKTGKWINDDDDWWYPECSVCGKNALEVQERGFKSNYCPHCGARMENSNEDD